MGLLQILFHDVYAKLIHGYNDDCSGKNGIWGAQL